MVAKSNIEQIRAFVKDGSINPNYVHTFPSYREAITAAQNLADTEGIKVYLREIIHRNSEQEFYKCGAKKSRISRRDFALWLKRGSDSDIEIKPSALSHRPKVDASELERTASQEEKFRLRLQTEVSDILRSETLEEAEAILDAAIGERAKVLRQTLVAERKALAESTKSDRIQWVKNDELRHYAITKQLGKPEYPEWTPPKRLNPKDWNRLAREGKVSVGSLKVAVKEAIQRITRTGLAATWSVKTRPAVITIAKHIRRGDWWILEDMTPGDLDQDAWATIETIHYNPASRDPELRYWRRPLEQRTQSVSWSVEVVTFDGHMISRTVSARDGYNAEQKMKAILSEAGLGGYQVSDVRQADADSFDPVDLDVLEQGTLDDYEIEYETDYELLDQLS